VQKEKLLKHTLNTATPKMKEGKTTFDKLLIAHAYFIVTAIKLWDKRKKRTGMWKR